MSHEPVDKPTPSLLVTARHQALWREIADALPHGDLAHDADHVLRVYAWAVRLAPEAGADVDVAGACALVHDLVHIPKDHPDRPLGGALSAQASVVHLRAAGYDADAIDAIVEAVRTSSWSRGLTPTSAVGRVLQDADRLDAIGALGVARCFATAQAMGGPGRFYDPADPSGDTGRTLDDRRNALDHFRIKLLRLSRGMHLPGARAEAERRQQAMLAFVEALLREIATAHQAPESHTTRGS